jgi:hypothetical protein
MTSKTRLMILALAVAVNAVAIASLHVAMVQGAEQAAAANQDYDHIVVSATRTPDSLASGLAKSSCPGTKAL